MFLVKKILILYAKLSRFQCSNRADHAVLFFYKNRNFSHVFKYSHRNLVYLQINQQFSFVLLVLAD